MEDQQSRGLYHRVLGDAWSRVDPAVRSLHLNNKSKTITGKLTIEQGGGWLGRIFVRIIGLPKARKDCEVRLVKTAIGDGEKWERNFGEDKLVTVQQSAPEGIWERIGVWEMLLRITVDNGALVHVQRRTRLCLGPVRMPWPEWMGPRGTAREEADKDGWVKLRLELFLPLAGRILTYHGRVKAFS